MNHGDDGGEAAGNPTENRRVEAAAPQRAAELSDQSETVNASIPKDAVVSHGSGPPAIPTTAQAATAVSDEAGSTEISQILVKTLTGKTITIDDLEASNSIEDVKAKIQDKVAVSLFSGTYFNLVYNGSIVDARSTLAELGVQPGDMLRMSLAVALVGGTATTTTTTKTTRPKAAAKPKAAPVVPKAVEPKPRGRPAAKPAAPRAAAPNPSPSPSPKPAKRTTRANGGDAGAGDADDDVPGDKLKPPTTKKPRAAAKPKANTSKNATVNNRWCWIIEFPLDNYGPDAVPRFAFEALSRALLSNHSAAASRERPGEVDALKMLQDFGNTRDVEVWPQAGWDTSIKIK